MKCKSKSRKVKRNTATLNLPKDYPWKVLWLLAIDLRQFLTESEFKLLEGIIRNRDINRLLDLSEVWGLQSMTSDDTSIAVKRAKYQLAALLKKFQFPSSRKAQEQTALDTFEAAERQCHLFNREGCTKLAMETEEWKVSAITYAKAFLQKLLGVELPSFDALTDRSRHGPGATLDTVAGHNSSYFKYAKWPYQCTSAAFRYAKEAIRCDARWLGALEDDYRTRFNVPKWALLDRKVFWQNVLQIVPGDRVCFVPKNAKTFRTITIGPTLNIYLQLGVDGFIRRRLKRWGVDLDDQTKNQEMARIGSLQGEDPYVTLDLKGASDTVSLAICRMLLPDEWNSYLLQLRSPCCELKGTTYWLGKMSAMGNGFTFVLESAIFTAIIYGVMVATDGYFSRDDFAVYGDDLIVRSHLSNRLIELLADCGFTLNLQKSFLSGPVRESCGCDWFEGKPVRPVFIDDTPSDVKELFNDINRLKRILSLRWGIDESFTVSQMKLWIPEYFRGIRGPLSDTEFDSHLHTEVPISRWVNGGWEYKRVVYRPTLVKAPLLSFRKLMHNLRGMDPPDIPDVRHPLFQGWSGLFGTVQPDKSFSTCRKLAGSGSRFTVHLRNAETVGTACSVADIWQSEYTESLPAFTRP